MYICYFKKNENQLRLIKQSWDNDYDLNRFSSGVYNLDRLCIKTIDINISDIQQNLFSNIINSISQIPDTFNDKSYIVLDGIDYHLTINIKNTYKEYHWKVPTKDIRHFEPLIEFLITNAAYK